MRNNLFQDQKRWPCDPIKKEESLFLEISTLNFRNARSSGFLEAELPLVFITFLSSMFVTEGFLLLAHHPNSLNPKPHQPPTANQGPANSTYPTNRTNQLQLYTPNPQTPMELQPPTRCWVEAENLGEVGISFLPGRSRNDPLCEWGMGDGVGGGRSNSAQVFRRNDWNRFRSLNFR